MEQFQLIAMAKFGVESITANELKKLGYTDLKVETGRVCFQGGFEDIARANLWLRTADRVLINVGEFTAVTFEELFEKTKALPWENWIPQNGEFPVTAKSVRSTLFSLSDCQAITKKAIVERLKQHYHGISWFVEDGPKYKVEVGILNDVVTLTLDTSGVGLHKRGYRTLTGGAPIKETMAAALVQLTKWKYDRVLIDPFCGTGTIPIEAAMTEMNMAPGRNRNFICEDWVQFPKDIFPRLKEEADALVRTDVERLKIQGSDIDDHALSMARYHAKQAGVDHHIHFQRKDMREISSHNKYGFIITNPPYGERLEDEKNVKLLYHDMGKVFGKLDTWSFYVITSFKDFEKAFGRTADKKRKLYNGMLECNYYQYFGPKPPKQKV